MGELEKVETLLLEIKALFDVGILDKKIGAYAICLNNLGNCYTALHLYQKAEPLLIEGAEIVKNAFGEDHPEYARRLTNLANLYLYTQQFNAAEPLLIQAKNIVEKAQDAEPSLTAFVLGNIGYLYMMLGELDKAEPYLEEAVHVEENWFGRQHYQTALRLGELALLYVTKGDLKKAETFYLEALSILKTTHENGYTGLIQLKSNIAQFYWSTQRFNEVIPLLKESCEGEKLHVLRSAQHLSERELSEHINLFSANQSKLLSFSLSRSTLFELSYDNTLFHKGFLLNSIQQLQGLAARNPASAEKLEEIKSLHRQLSGQYATSMAERDSAGVAVLETKVNTLEKELAREVAGYSEAVRQVRWQEVQAVLKPGEAALEFVDFQFLDPEPTDSILYAALVILPAEDLLKAGRPNEPQFIPLFEKKELLPLLRGATGGNNFLKINALYASKPFADGQKSPFELIWQPLEQVLKNTSTVYCSSSGLLHYLNLAAIPMPDGKPFGDTRHLVLLGSTRSLAMPNGGNQNSNDAYLAGGIRYESNTTTAFFANQGIASRAPQRSGTPFFVPDSSSIRGEALNYLPATATEVREIGKMLRAGNFSAKVDTGFFASEEAFRSLGIGKPSPRLIHLATHGYFFSDPKGKKAKDAGQDPIFKMSEHPMIRSGLIMAGAKQAWLTGKHPEGREDGILTAYEISQMNLSNTELVVLSACETGLGQVSGNEGVYGLQRAFKIAGAKYLIMSLWKVDDQSAKTFMTTFYEAWLNQKIGIPEAFRQTQEKMRKKYPNPYDWAGFILVE